jgi:methionine synthase I (cobalamin-dependent)
LRDAGAAFLGGCCGSTPEFIRALVTTRQAAL